ncbi:glycoside hydrolase family 68 protein [Halobellus ruber]|uniref:Glycoside hydrolase family 68 protein n=1 Tax=Halobellus ruber TaxID=2761102 RepID=A0A7J9SKQ6_9EURY|nr:glycoside hydrolase family 68 protein [Halobellus ruber]MBB6646963.1 glycoside hydrolase family 68 protein [Halobellus ruber]
MTGERDDDRRRPSQPPRWTRAQAARIERSADTVAPVIEPPAADPAADLHVWDTWLLRNRHGELADVDGWRVLFSLTAPEKLLPGKRHDVAEIRFFYSRNGTDWHGGETIFRGDALGQRQWAGSALYDGGELYLYYTAAGDDAADELNYTQRIAVGHGGRFVGGEEGVRSEGPWTHEVLLEPDGEWYETESQSRAMIYTFRDPWFFTDPATGQTCLLFEANTPVPPGSDRCGGDGAQQEFNGSVGVAVSPSGDPLSWELRPPLFDAVCVNQELERPHIVVHDGRYYLFVSSHMHTFAPGIRGYDGLYGFVADSLRGEYEPLNGSGLVVTNPASVPYQAYSWIAFPHREEILVGSFYNYREYAGESLDGIADLSEAEQRRRFGGTLSPTIRVAVDGDRTRITGTLAHWDVPTPAEDLPDSPEYVPPEGTDVGEGRPSGLPGRMDRHRTGGYSTGNY